MDIRKYVRYLGLKSPFSIDIRSNKSKRFDACYYALYKNGGTGKLHKHIIRVSIGNAEFRSIETLIVHELIHAWQEEKGLDEIHGPYFKGMARLIQTEFGLRDIYLPDTDVT